MTGDLSGTTLAPASVSAKANELIDIISQSSTFIELLREIGESNYIGFNSEIQSPRGGTREVFLFIATGKHVERLMLKLMTNPDAKDKD